MLNMYCKLKALYATRDRGVSAVEYGLILAAIVIAIGALVFALGDQVKQIFTDAKTNIKHP
jgi:Flp pilus assembly pilin Flp